MPTATADDWSVIATRLKALPGALDGYIATLREGIAQGVVPARRQVREVVDPDRPLHERQRLLRDVRRRGRPDRGPAAGIPRPRTRRQRQRGARRVRRAGAVPQRRARPGREREGCRRPRAVRPALAPLPRRDDRPRRDLRVGRRGARPHGRRAGVDRARDQGRRLGRRGRGVPRAGREPQAPRHRRAAALDAGDERPGGRRARQDPLRHPRADPPPGVHDRADARRAGSTTPARPTTSRAPAACGGRCPRASNPFDTWRELTTVYHEGVPGHHLQIAQAVYNRAQLNSWRRLLGGTSGHAEGLGAVRRAADGAARLPRRPRRPARDARRSAHARRARRPRHRRAPREAAPRRRRHAGTPTTRSTSCARNVNMSDEFVQFEVNRYLGWPGQAPVLQGGPAHLGAAARRRARSARARTSRSRSSTSARSTSAASASTRSARRSRAEPLDRLRDRRSRSRRACDSSRATSSSVVWVKSS